MGLRARRTGHKWSRWVAVVIPALFVATACATPVGDEAPDDARVPIAVGLNRNQDGLAQAADSAADPNNAQFLAPLSAQEIKSRYGADPNNAQQALSKLQQAGMTGDLDPTGSIITGEMSVKDAEDFFDIDLRLVDDDGVKVIRPPAKVAVPNSISAYATNVAGFTRSIPSGTSTPTPPSRNELPPCPTSISLTAKLRKYYGLEGIYSQGNTGQGISLAMLEIDQLSQPAIQLFEKCFKVDIPPVTNQVVADANPEVFGDEAQESTLDIVAAGLLAPNLDGIRTYQFDPYTSMLFALNEAVNDSYQPNGPEILSTSISVCEDNLSQSELTMMEWVLSAGAASGLTTVASAGDSGSSGCYPATKAQKNQYPGTSAYASALGGTQFAAAGDATTEVVWNNSPSQEQAGGGAQVSRLPKPWYQSAIPGPNNRITPDIALVAEPADFGPIPVCKNNGSCQMQVVGGTSATAPGYAAATATMLQQLRKQSQPNLRLGSMNPMLYSLAASPARQGVFHDVIEGNNDLYGTGCCTAVPGYDSASGWGSVNFGGMLTAYASKVPRQ